ncbi:MAG: hypothetical protein J6D28_00745 [Bacilli bacterium]|nr:hypothetical protein [Bacilli bacterium]
MLNDKYTFYKLNYFKYIILIKSGNFYITLDNDALIVSNIFNYKIKDSSSVIRTGFPLDSLNKVVSKLEDLSINYLVIDSDIVSEQSFDSNQYDTYLMNIQDYKIVISRITKINNTLKSNMLNCNIKNVINDIEKILCKIDC